MEPQKLIDSGVCVSFSEAKRLIACVSVEKLEEKIEKANHLEFGRKPHKRNIVWPKIKLEE